MRGTEGDCTVVSGTGIRHVKQGTLKYMIRIVAKE